MFYSPANGTVKGGLSAGVALLVRAWLDVWQQEEQFGSSVVQGRGVHAFLRTRKAGVMALYCTYWHTSTGRLVLTWVWGSR